MKAAVEWSRQQIYRNKNAPQIHLDRKCRQGVITYVVYSLVVASFPKGISVICNRSAIETCTNTGGIGRDDAFEGRHA